MVQCLSVLSNQTHSNKSPESRSTKTRSKSVPHFSSLNGKSEKIANESDKEEENKTAESSEMSNKQDEMRSRRNSRRTVPDFDAEGKSALDDALFNNINPLENKTDDEKCNRMSNSSSKLAQNG